MSELILHHHDPSPFAEKIRLAFGIKQLAWRSVQLSMVMPRPELMPLTGGYRKVPVLQAGADVYCDTRLIARELERRYPAPPLFPAGSEGLALALASWSDRTFFEPGAALAMALNRASIPQEVIDDRMGLFNFMDFDNLEAEAPHMLAQFRASLALVERMLADGRYFLLGEAAGFADIDAWFPVWIARSNFGIAGALFALFPRLLAWEARMAAIGHGIRSELDAREALAIARASDPLTAAGVDAGDPQQFRCGDRVTVTPDDYGRIAVEGELVTLSIDEVAIRRETAETGAVVVHFPRLGYRVTQVA
ncbi:MAG TPA: glutathione S-transferase family protein [Steroidobacteraceae bacterium]|nr:glutathione S-transferase family protein [Steroidobacteraceae bacterium]